MTDGWRALVKGQAVTKLGKMNGTDFGQLLQGWGMCRGTIPLGKNSTTSRIKSNLDVRTLGDQGMKAIDGLAKPGDGERTIDSREYLGVVLFSNQVPAETVPETVHRQSSTLQNFKISILQLWPSNQQPELKIPFSNSLEEDPPPEPPVHNKFPN